MLKHSKQLYRPLGQSLKIGAALTLASYLPVMAYAADDGHHITFEQVFENPDDDDLNFRYAQQEADSGNLLKAAATLERMLYSQPNWDSARLYYAYVLYQLDDPQAARHELGLLNARPLTSEQRELHSRYMDMLNGTAPRASSSNEANIGGQVRVGVRYDDNAGNALRDVVVGSNKRDGTAAFASAQVYGKTPLFLGLDGRGGAGAQLRRNSDNSRADFHAYNGYVGLGGRLGAVVWSTDFAGRKIYVSGESYLTEIGPRARLTVPLSETVKAFAGAGAVYQDYKALSNTPNERFRSGQKYSGIIGVAVTPTDKTQYTVSLGLSQKDATAAIFAYDSLNITGGLRHRFSDARYAKASASYRTLDYNSITGANFGASSREDDHIYVRAAYGARLDSLGLGTLDNLFIEGGLSYTDRSSNLTGLDYSNTGADVALVWEF